MSGKEEIINQFVQISNNVQTILNKLKDLADNHFDYPVDNLEWGHVGNITHIESQLKTMIAFVKNERD